MTGGKGEQLIPWLPSGYRALVVAPGAIGSAMADRLRGDEACAEVLIAGRGRDLHLDLADEQSIAALFGRLSGPLHLVLFAGGLLHDTEVQPEKALRDVRQDWLARLYAVNAIGPALVARYAEPFIPRNASAFFGVLGGRVGSIDDNRLGGWYGYRMAKAAAAQFVRTLSIEWGRTRPSAVALLLHPGTVDSALSKPFQRNVAPERLFTPERSADALLSVIASSSPTLSGRHLAWDGRIIPG